MSMFVCSIDHSGDSETDTLEASGTRIEAAGQMPQQQSRQEKVRPHQGGGAGVDAGGSRPETPAGSAVCANRADHYGLEN